MDDGKIVRQVTGSKELDTRKEENLVEQEQAQDQIKIVNEEEKSDSKVTIIVAAR